MSRIIEVLEYNPEWPAQYELAAQQIQQALGDNCVTIHHVGSTAVPGLAAKPILDIVPVVKDILAVNTENLEALGYVARGEMGMPFRRFFNKGEPQRTQHLHVWEQGNPEIEKHLLFRNYLIAHPALAKQYADIKYNLAKQFKTERFNYTSSKDGFIKDILVKAGFTGITVVQALLDSEWQAYHRIRKSQVFDHIPNLVYDFKHPAVTAENHFHFVMLQGITIVAVAQIEMLDAETAALRTLATDEQYKNQGFGSKLLTLMERWISHQGKHKILMHAAGRAESFYRKRGYINMHFDDVGVSKDHVDLGKII